MPSYHWQGCDTPRRLLPLQCDLSSSDCLNVTVCYIHQLCMPLPSVPLTRTNIKIIAQAQVGHGKNCDMRESLCKCKLPNQKRGIFFWCFLWCVPLTVTSKFWRGSFTWGAASSVAALIHSAMHGLITLITFDYRKSMTGCWNNDKDSFSQILIGANRAAVVWTCLERGRSIPEILLLVMEVQMRYQAKRDHTSTSSPRLWYSSASACSPILLEFLETLVWIKSL